MDGWAYKGSILVVKIAIHAGNKSPQVVDTVDAVVGGLEKDRQDGSERWTNHCQRAVH